MKSKSGSFLKKILHVSLGDIGSFISTPSMIPLRLRLRNSSLVEICSSVGHVSFDEVERLQKNFLLNHRFFQELNTNLIKERGRRTSCEGWFELLYVLTRLLKPEIFVETGVFDGTSSAVILQAMQDNGRGRLISIDLPARNVIKNSTHRMRECELPSNCDPGWVIPQYLRGRHKILLGDSKDLLQNILVEAGEVDMFLHDSLHIFEHQWFEYASVWPHLAEGGMLLSDDVLWNRAFHDFCKNVRKDYQIYQGFGVVRK